MVLFSHPDAVRDVFALGPGDRARGPELGVPAEPFAGPHSILLLDGDEHLRDGG